jgi:hypothetical protein
MKDRIMPGPRDEDDEEEKRDTDDENDEYEPQGDEAEPWQVGAKYCTSEGQDRSMERVAQAAPRRFQFRTEIVIEG